MDRSRSHTYTLIAVLLVLLIIALTTSLTIRRAQDSRQRSDWEPASLLPEDRSQGRTRARPFLEARVSTRLREYEKTHNAEGLVKLIEKAARTPSPKGPQHKLWRVGLTGARRSPNLALNLEGVHLEPAEFQLLCKLPTLRSLGLNHTNVTDDDLSLFQGHPTLRALQLSHTEVTDAGMRHLQKIPHLSGLRLSHVNVSQNVIDALRKAREKALGTDRICIIYNTKDESSGR